MPYTFVDFDALTSHPVYEDTTILEQERQEGRALLEKELGAVDPRYREVLILHYLEELSYKEIAEVLHIPLGTVGIRLKRGKELLRQLVTEPNHYE